MGGSPTGWAAPRGLNRALRLFVLNFASSAPAAVRERVSGLRPTSLTPGPRSARSAWPTMLLLLNLLMNSATSVALARAPAEATGPLADAATAPVGQAVRALGGEPVGGSTDQSALTTSNATTTSVGCSPAVIAVGESTGCTATVSDSTPGLATTPTGSVTFTSSGSGNFSAASCQVAAGSVDPLTGAATASCSVRYTSTALGTGVRTITATYGGDATHAGSSGTTLVADPPKRTTTTTVSCSPGTVPVGAPTTCTATVTDTDTGTATTPTGTVSFTNSGGPGTFSSTTCTLSGTGGSATCSVTYTPSAVSSGMHTIKANYGGDATHSDSQATTTVAVTAKRSTSTSVSCSPATVSLGTSTTCTATVTDTDLG